MNKIFTTLLLLTVPLAAYPQMRWMLNGTTPLSFVLNGGTSSTPIYIEVNNPAANAITTIGKNADIISESEFNMVKWDISNNSGEYVVPFGVGTSEYLPLFINIGTAGNTGGCILFSTWHTPADNEVPVSFRPSDVSNMAAMYTSPGGQPSNADNSWNSVDRFWVIDTYTIPDISYTTKPSLNNITFRYINNAGSPSETAAPNVFAEADLLAQRFNSTQTTWGDWLGTGATDSIGSNFSQVKSGAVSAANFFRSWTLSSQNSPLPIALSSFTDACINGMAYIEWTSETEVNNAYYTVKKTADNIHFETVGTITGAGTTSLRNNYSLIDNSPFAGTSYYFLYQTDYDGVMNPAGSAIPFSGCGNSAVSSVNGFNTATDIEIQINSDSYTNVNISLVTMLGQVIMNENHAVTIGYNEFRISHNYSAGIYLLNLRNEKINYTKKLILWQ